MTVPIDQQAAAAIVRDVAAGDERAFTRLVAAYHRDLIRVAFVVCGDADVAEDAVQSAWGIAWRKIGGVRDPDRIRTWLIAVAANEARQLARRRGRRSIREIRVDLDPLEIADPSASTELRAAGVDLAEADALAPDFLDRCAEAWRPLGPVMKVMAGAVGLPW